MNKLLAVLLFIGNCGLSAGQDMAQWRGPERSGIYQEENLLKKWPDEGPPLLWENSEVGSGWGSAAVASDGIFIVGKKGRDEYLSKLNVEGELQWQVRFGEAWDGAYPDARSTPTVENGKVYAISGKGEVGCYDAESGEELWWLDAYSKFNGSCTMWGVCESPLIIEDKLIFTPGGFETMMVALNKNNGESVWSSESLKDSIAYVSPLLIERGNKKILISISANYLFGFNAENGGFLWKYKYSDLKWNQTHFYSPIINCNTPVYHDGKIFISKGYDHLAAQFSINENGTEIELIRTDSVFDVHIGGMVLHDGYLYGANWLHNRDGNWCCVNWNTGELMFETHWHNKGSIIMADGLLYCYEEKGGNLALVMPNQEEFEVISSFKVPKGTGPHWAHPVINNGVLYVRHGSVLMAYNISD